MRISDEDLQRRFQPSPLRPGAWLYWPAWPLPLLAELPDDAAKARIMRWHGVLMSLMMPLTMAASLATLRLRPGLVGVLIVLLILVLMVPAIVLVEVWVTGARIVPRGAWQGDPWEAHRPQLPMPTWKAVLVLLGFGGFTLFFWACAGIGFLRGRVVEAAFWGLLVAGVVAAGLGALFWRIWRQSVKRWRGASDA